MTNIQPDKKISQNEIFESKSNFSNQASKKQEKSKYSTYTKNLSSLIKKINKIGCILILAASSAAYIYKNYQDGTLPAFLQANYSNSGQLTLNSSLDQRSTQANLPYIENAALIQNRTKLLQNGSENGLLENPEQLTGNTFAFNHQKTEQEISADAKEILKKEQTELEITDEEITCLSAAPNDENCQDFKKNILNESVQAKDLKMFNFILRAVESRGIQIHPKKIRTSFLTAGNQLGTTIKSPPSYISKAAFEKSKQDRDKDIANLSSMLKVFANREQLSDTLSAEDVYDLFMSIYSTTHLFEKELGKNLIKLMRSDLNINGIKVFFSKHYSENPLISAAAYEHKSLIQAFLDSRIVESMSKDPSSLDSIGVIFIYLRIINNKAGSGPLLDEAARLQEKMEASNLLKQFLVQSNYLQNMSKELREESKQFSKNWDEIETFVRERTAPAS